MSAEEKKSVPGVSRWTIRRSKKKRLAAKRRKNFPSELEEEPSDDTQHQTTECSSDTSISEEEEELQYQHNPTLTTSIQKQNLQSGQQVEPSSNAGAMRIRGASNASACEEEMGTEDENDHSATSVGQQVVVHEEVPVLRNMDVVSDSDDDFGSDCEDLAVHFLEEDPFDIAAEAEQPVQEDVVAAEVNPHPPAPGGGGDSGGSSSEPSSDDDEEPSSEDDVATFSFDHRSLNANLRVVRNRSVKESFALDIALSLRHNWSYESLLGQFKAKNFTFGHKFFPTSKRALWRVLNRQSVGFRKHGYCNSCDRYLGLLTGLPNQVICPCGFQIEKKKLKWFLSLSLKRQLRQFLSLPGVARLMRHREDRHKRSQTALEDILDGQQYRRLQMQGGVLESQWNFSYIFNTDGFSLSKSSNLQAWPIYVKLNELIPSVRQKNVFLVALTIDRKEPNMNTLLRPFVAEANRLSLEGVAWKPDGVNEVHSRFIPTCLCVDAKARCALLNMSQFNGRFGCTFCTHFGVDMGHSRKYPAHPHEGVPEPVLRTDESIRADMIAAHEAGNWVNGVHGPSELMNLEYFDLADMNALDDLHPLYSGVAKFHTELLLTEARPNGLDYEILLRQVDARLLQAKTPTCVSRKPRSLIHRHKFKGTEWRNWLLYYGVPCLEGLLPARYINHFQMLAHAVFLLSQDVVAEADVNNAERLLERYVLRFEDLFGVINMRYNVHLLNHVPRSVRNWGPLWVTSTFDFESWNHHLMKNVTSPTGALDQIVTRYLMKLHIRFLMHDENFPEDAKNELKFIMDTPRHVIRREVPPNIFCLGSGVRRPPSADEMQVLALEGLHCEELSEFKSTLIGNTQYRSLEYRSIGKSDNTEVYTWDNTFCQIESIVVLEHDGDEVCGLFVSEHQVDLPFQTARHIARVRMNADLPHFLRTDKLRCPVVKIPVIGGDTYVVPLNNLSEID